MVTFSTAQQIRDEIARVVRAYDGIQHFTKSGDQIQWGGERLCDGWRFPTPDGRAHFVPVAPQELAVADGHFLLSTRRGKQFNTMVFWERDPLNGASRDALLMSSDDARELGLRDGDAVSVRSDTGEVAGRVHVAPIRPRNVQMFFPEANLLIAAGRRDEVALVPDYNAVVEVRRVEARTQSQ
jgi:predicted molibdopterin-dependent oxidoreductase YjgC